MMRFALPDIGSRLSVRRRVTYLCSRAVPRWRCERRRAAWQKWKTAAGSSRRGNNRRGRAKPLDGKAAGRALAAAEGIAESSAADEATLRAASAAAVLELRTRRSGRVSARWSRAQAPVESIVCLGVGSYGSSVSARYQLALALLLRETLLGVSAAADAAPPPPTAGGGAALDVYDPVLSEAEVAFARARGCGLPARNEEGRRAAARRTLFFMPHCGRQLYANVVAANWGGEALGRVLILGNSFAAYADALTDAQTADAARESALARATPFATEREREERERATAAPFATRSTRSPCTRRRRGCRRPPTQRGPRRLPTGLPRTRTCRARLHAHILGADDQTRTPPSRSLA